MTIHELVALQRSAFLQNRPYPVENRLDQLEMLKKAIQKREDLICAALRQDLGKSHEEAYMTEIGPVLAEISYAMRHLSRWARPRRVRTPLSQFPGRSYILREPYGVALIMAPWHYPFQLIMTPFVGTMAAGNHCILKPSAYAPAISQVVFRLIEDCFPPEQAAVVQGGRAENQALLEERFDYIFFTGGVNVGKQILEQAARHVTPVTLELGGKSPCIVDETADLKTAARRIAFGKAVNSGQSCVVPDYLLVQEKVRDPLISGIRDCWRQFYGDDPLQSYQWPRMINEKHYRRVMDLMAGEEIFCGGMGDGSRIAPTILINVGWDAPVMREEIFGPVLPVLTFRSMDEAIQRVNSRERPLALYLFSRRPAVQDRVLTQVSFGGGCVNDTIAHPLSPRLPFGGVGQSGMGKYHGKASFDTFTYEKSVLLRRNHPDIGTRYPPFDQKKLRLIRKILK